MKQTFTFPTFSWLGRPTDSVKEQVGNYVSRWPQAPSPSVHSSLQNFVLAGIGQKAERPQSVSLNLMRHYLNALAWPLDKKQRLFDAGDLISWASPSMRDVAVSDLVEQAIRKEVSPVLMSCEARPGYGFFAGACLSTLQTDHASLPGYIRLGSMLLTSTDRNDEGSVGHCMHDLCTRLHQPFRCLQLGVQEAVNQKSTWVEASSLGINALTLAACEPDLLLLYLRNFCESVDAVVLSIDLDVLGEPYAPGDHRATSFGLRLDVLLPAIRWVAGQGKLAGVEVTGLVFDEHQPDRRPRLAASLLQDLLSHWF